MAKQLHIFGLVQGVGYRASFEARARALNLSGWVRNRRDGSVEALVRGAAPAMEAIVAWARQGPAGALVREVCVTELDDAAVPDDGFEIAPSC